MFCISMCLSKVTITLRSIAFGFIACMYNAGGRVHHFNPVPDCWKLMFACTCVLSQYAGFDPNRHPLHMGPQAWMPTPPPPSPQLLILTGDMVILYRRFDMWNKNWLWSPDTINFNPTQWNSEVAFVRVVVKTTINYFSSFHEVQSATSLHMFTVYVM